MTSLGIPPNNFKIHPDCQSGLSPDLVARRKVEWGFKILGAFVGTDEYVVSALRRKMDDFQRLTQALLLYPNVQARYNLHRFCFNAKVNYWTRLMIISRHTGITHLSFSVQKKSLKLNVYQIVIKDALCSLPSFFDLSFVIEAINYQLWTDERHLYNLYHITTRLICKISPE